MKVKEIILYEAFDGEQFHAKEVCENYEYTFVHFNDYIRFYDSNMEQIPVDPIADSYSVCKAYNRASYIRVLPADGYKSRVKYLVDLYYGFYLEPHPNDDRDYYLAGLYEGTEDGFILKEEQDENEG